MNRPEGAVTSTELEALLDKHGKVRVYTIYHNWWKYFVKYPAVGPADSSKYCVIMKNGEEVNLDFHGIIYGMRTWEYGIRTWERNYIFTNYWLYYAYMLKEGKHDEILP